MVCLMCWLAMTLNVYTEAGGEGYKGMEMVADTVVNRTKSKQYPDTVEAVILQPKQFSWTSRLRRLNTKELVSYNKDLVTSSRLSKRKEREAYIIAARVAYKAVKAGYKPKHNYIHFYSGSKRPQWSINRHTTKYGGHYFVK